MPKCNNPFIRYYSNPLLKAPENVKNADSLAGPAEGPHCCAASWIPAGRRRGAVTTTSDAISSDASPEREVCWKSGAAKRHFSAMTMWFPSPRCVRKSSMPVFSRASRPPPRDCPSCSTPSHRTVRPLHCNSPILRSASCRFSNMNTSTLMAVLLYAGNGSTPATFWTLGSAVAVLGAPEFQVVMVVPLRHTTALFYPGDDACRELPDLLP